MADTTLPRALADVAAERQRQITAEGYDHAHDDAHEDFELSRAASVYALFAAMPALDRDFALRHGPHLYGANIVWPWGREHLNLTTRRADLVKAGALILAEIERLDRKEG